jgi:hypothetical protein
MNDQEAFEKWLRDNFSKLVELGNKGGLSKMTDDFAQCWQAACEYKQKDIDDKYTEDITFLDKKIQAMQDKLAESTRKLLIFSDDLDQAGNELFMQEGKIKELQAENKKLRNALESIANSKNFPEPDYLMAREALKEVGEK